MKLTLLLSTTITAIIAGAPVVAEAKDKHHHSHHSNHRYSHSYGPRFGVNFGYGYPGYYSRPYGYGYGYGYPYYYHRPTIGLAFSTYGSPVYRGVPANGSYSDSLAVDVQRELQRRGYYRGPIDGDIGPASRAAIRGYQSDRGFSATGRIDARLIRSLGIG